MAAAPRYDLLAVDLDGTLLNSQHALPQANRAALHRAHEAGVRIVLCTGRAFTETRPVLAELGLDLDAAVTVFGALVTDIRSGRTLHRTALPQDVGRAATAWFRAAGYPVLWLTDPDLCGADGYMLSGPRRHPAVDRWLQRSPCVIANVDELPSDCAAPVRLSIIDDSAVLEDLSTRFQLAFDGQLTHNVLHAPPYSLSLIEAFAPQVNKWYGITQLCRMWQIDPRRTVAVGDDVNDLAMISQAGLGVAMANARPVVHAAARVVTASNDDCGVARLVDEHVLA
jgi:Cof subfamily protein (haloacid dehalogenase superfamily)